MSFRFTRLYTGELKAAILDWAGTTVDYGSCAPAQVFLTIFSQYGISIDERDARRFMGMHKRDHIKSVLTLPSVAQRFLETQGHAPTEDDVDVMFERFLPLQLNTLKEHSQLIPGALSAIREFRARKLKIGTTTGYTRVMMDVVTKEAKQQGFEPDVVVCSDEVTRARPSPFMCFSNAEQLGIFPMASMVKIGDTPVDIEEGLNAGMWTIGLSRCGNELGLSESSARSLSDDDLKQRIVLAEERLYAAGAHYVIESIEHAPPIIDQINQRLSRSERP